MIFFLRCLLGLSAVIFALRAAEPVWPQFRGPKSNPTASNPALPDTWSKTKNIEWAADIPGRGWSSPIVTGERIFLTTAVTEGKSKAPQMGTEYSNQYVAELMKKGLKMEEVLAAVKARDMEMPEEVMLHYFLYCLNLRTGAVEWKQEIHAGHPPVGRHRKNSFTSETPITDGERIYVYIGGLGLYAYDLSGKQVWKTPIEALPIILDFGMGGSAALYGDQLIVVHDNEKQQYIASFDKRTGKQRWRTNRDIQDKTQPRRSSWSTPYFWTHKRTEIVTVGPGTAVSYDLEGKELWRINGTSSNPVPSPFVADGILYLNGGMGKGFYAIKAGASGDISLAKDTRENEYVIWSDPRGGTYLPTHVAYEGFLYTLNEKGIFTRFEAKTGKMTYRERLDIEGAAFTSSPWAYNGRIFCLSEEGKTYVVPAGDKFTVLHTNPLEEMAQATPAIVGDRLLLRTETKLYSIRAAAR
ncbi:MAG: PQQ-binding-like beta-propeller repeat protein [Acidobacteria bacterium]|nr:PQQ-binding-like beta-propeller repeat protein [Acidobacteriota bacterium]